MPARLYELALKRYQQAIFLDPGFGLGHYNVGAAYHGMGPLDKAFVHYERAIECLGPSAWAQGQDMVELLGAGTRTQEAAANVVAGLAPTSAGLAASPRSHP